MEYGNVKISDEVVAAIASVAAMEIPGVVNMSGGFTGGFSEMLGKKSQSKGVKVELNDNDAIIDVNIIVEYGKNISEIGKKVQENVKNSVETMTELNVSQVNVYIQGVNISKNNKEKEEPKGK
ncbi:MAG: Asp23/Gls24 family envelope stress response protein [Tissierellia bacterium]|nr:Asp23/Gls24 family envelope stress response protein [Tissierellia bacterium]